MARRRALIVNLNWIVALRLLGFVPALPLPALRKLSRPMYVGFWIDAASGSLLPASALQANLNSRYFLCKMCFIVLAIVNLELTRRRVFTDPAIDRNQIPRLGRRVAWLAPDADAPLPDRRVAALSILLWLLVLYFGRLIMYEDALRYTLGIA